MGLLDDAIREHLDLKRRRGADPTEIERAEREALGPVRRGPEPNDVAETGVEQPPLYDDQQGAPVDDRVGAGYADESAGGAYDAEDELDWERPAAADEGQFEPFDDEGAGPAPRLAGDVQPSYDADTRAGEPPPSAAASPSIDQPTQHMSLDHLESEAEAEDEFEQSADPGIPPPHPAGAPRTPERRTPRAAAESSGGETMEYDVESAVERKDASGQAEDDDVLEETPEFLQDTPDHDRLWFEQRPPRDFDFDG